VAAPTDQPKRIPQVASELWEMSLAYAKQETIDPLKGLGRFLGYGLGGVLVLALGSVLVLLGALRLLQTETGSTFTGNLSWVPYVIVLLGVALIGLLVVWRIVKRKGPGL
jgi:hypothetical protein